MTLLSVEDLFTVGVGFDLFGGVYLGRGLLAKPDVIVARSGSYVGHSPPAMGGLIESRADGEIGLGSILAGFALQAGGYIALLGGTKIETGTSRALFGVGLLVLAIGILAVCALPLRRWRIRSLAVNVARVGFGGERVDPAARQLALLGPHLGYPECPPNARWADVDAYARQHFKVETTRMTSEDQRLEAEADEQQRRESPTSSTPPQLPGAQDDTSNS